MEPYVTPFLLNGHALPVAADEPHAQVGAHLRVSHNPLFGLPVAPFLVWRAIARSRKALNKRQTVQFRYEDGGPLTAPFSVTPDRPVIARIPVGPRETCVWAQLQAVPANGLAQPDDPAQPIPVPSVNPTTGFNFGRILSNNPSLSGAVRRRDLGLNINSDLLGRLAAGLGGDDGSLKVEAMMDTPFGTASIGSRSVPNYAFSGPGIVELRITGRGNVAGLDWIEANDPQNLQWERFTVLNLPANSGPRYLSVSDPELKARIRVNEQAPKRRPLQDTNTLPASAAAPPFSPTEERERVKSLLPFVAGDLATLINDPTPPLLQTAEDTIFDENGSAVGASSTSRLHRVFQGFADPGTASYLGYKTRDDNWRETEDRIIFYQITGFFRDATRPISQDGPDPDANLFAFQAALNRVDENQRSFTEGAVLEIVANTVGPLADFDLKVSGEGGLTPRQDYIGLGAVVLADMSAPLDPVEPPTLTRAVHKTWLPETPPSAKREVQVDVEDVRVTGLLAAAKRNQTPPGASVEALNKQNDEGWRLPLVLSLNSQDAMGNSFIRPGEGFIADRKAEAGAVRYYLAQQDRFGRFSNWANRLAAAGPRPKPPRPVVQGFYTQPDIADAATTGGEIFVKIAVPEAEALAPGAHLLQSLDLTLTELDAGGNPTTSSTVTLLESAKVAEGSGPVVFFLRTTRTGPILNRAEQRKMRLTARWRDTTGVQGDVSVPVTLKMTDPRPPEQITVPDQLQYAARPDVMGLSWVEHRWAAQAGQSNFAIYHADETRLRGWLSISNETALLASLDAAADAAARATLFRANRSKFPDHVFERLKDVNVDFASGQTGFRHPVSGSLRALCFYLIAAEAESGAKPVLTDLDFIVYGIPNSDPPARPVLEVVPSTPEPGENETVAEIGISLLAGTTPGANWRLRRSSFESASVIKMPVVATGTMGALDTDTGFQTASFRDDGPVEIAAHALLHPWKQYSWVAEVQGAPESGSVAAGRSMAGRWSRASDPVSMVIVPDGPPDAINPVSLSVSGTTLVDGLADAELRFTHQTDLSAGPLGQFTLRIAYRPAPGLALTVLDELTISDHRDAALPTDPADSFAFLVNGAALDPGDGKLATGSMLVLELIDPLGRASATTQRDI